MSSSSLAAFVHQLRYEAAGTISVELRPLAPAQVASLMETCKMLTADRLHDLGGTVHWPVLLDKAMS